MSTATQWEFGEISVGLGVKWGDLVILVSIWLFHRIKDFLLKEEKALFSSLPERCASNPQCYSAQVQTLVVCESGPVE